MRGGWPALCASERPRARVLRACACRQARPRAPAAASLPPARFCVLRERAPRPCSVCERARSRCAGGWLVARGRAPPGCCACARAWAARCCCPAVPRAREARGAARRCRVVEQHSLKPAVIGGPSRVQCQLGVLRALRVLKRECFGVDKCAANSSANSAGASPFHFTTPCRFLHE